ncbi:protein phosphatase 2C [Cavenderia fasciculata]|uniref:Protein phosphatase 2C n=1 Tax=Cavenderia fasciculata TaxID=261658 RepID=F4PWG9_CACFS|nr:protein phosphatase 2C [Cavenderia fasciculata]EGG20333.1 protein phosphatase 2C [Cavenderia fasciculata]|eukprot:XP_004367316.1 protein phosphatase 2C [Cavenderia fasciculata]
MNIINYFRHSQNYSLYNNPNPIFHQVNDLNGSQEPNNNNNNSSNNGNNGNNNNSNNGNQKQSSSSSSQSSTSQLQPSQTQLSILQQNGKYNNGNTQVNRTSSFTPSPVLYMTPMAPIDYGISDDMLMEEKLDGGCLSATSSPAFPSSEQDAVVPDYISSMMMSCLDSELSIKYGISSFQGTRRYMEDRQKIKIGFDNNPNVSLFGVFDGHGGYKCAEFVKKRIVQYMNKFLKENKTGYSSGKNSNGSSAASSPAMYESPNWLKKNVIGCGSYNEIQQRSEFLQQALFSTFQTLDNRYYKKYRQKNESGTTCLVALLSAPPNLQPLLIVANAGDSRGVLCRSGKAIALSFDHKPGNPKEKQRINTAGGKVEWDYSERIWRVAGVLSVSRGIGDIPLKKWVICDPEFVVIPLKCISPNSQVGVSSGGGGGGAGANLRNSGKFFGYSSPLSVGSPLTPSKLSSSPFSPKLLLSRKSKRHSSPLNTHNQTPAGYAASSPMSGASNPLSPESSIPSSPNFNNHSNNVPTTTTTTTSTSDDSVVPDIDNNNPIEIVSHQHRNHLSNSSSPNSSPKLSRRQSVGVVKKSAQPSSTSSNQQGSYNISKNKHCSPMQPATPNIELDQYFVVATDGIWDAFTNQELIDFINNTIYDIYSTKRLDWDPTDIAKRVTMEACIRGSGDNSTVIIVKCLSQ